MGGITEHGASFDTKTSPRHAAIERAQAELRLEYDMLQERKRELDFLEKGGNLLDYKFSPSASISLQSTSLTDQLAEHHVTSEAKGSFALAASPHGDSVESSGGPGVSISREANIADNLLLLDHENNHLDGEKKVKPRGKRASVAQLEQISDFDSSPNVKESEDSFSIRHGAKGQAYARRNRSRTNRNHVSLASSDSNPENRASTLSPTRYNTKGMKECLPEGEVEVGAHSLNNNSKAASQNANVAVKDSDDRADMDLDPLQNNISLTEANVGGSDCPKQADDTNDLQQLDLDIIPVVPENVSVGIPLQSGEKMAEEEPLCIDDGYTSLEYSKNKKDLVSGKGVNEIDSLDMAATVAVSESLSAKTCTTNTTNSTADNIKERHDDENCCKENSALLVTSNGKIDKELGDKLTDDRTFSLLDENNVKEKDNKISKKVRPDEQGPCTEVKDEVSDIKIDEKCGGTPTANTLSRKLNGEITVEPCVEPNNSLWVSNYHKEAAGTKNSEVLHNCQTSDLEKRNSNSAFELQNPSTELTQKACEDAILKEACMIEANLKRAGNFSSCNKLFEKRVKCHWDFVLEEMVWMANDFMQERLWKITAAAQISQLISYNGRSNFELMNIRNKQKNMARIMVKSIMRFWHAAEVFSCNRSTFEGDDRGCTRDIFVSWNLKQNEQKIQVNDSEHSGKVLTLGVQDYAVRFLKFNPYPSNYSTFAEALTTPDRQNDPGILEMLREVQEPQENIFFVVPPGAMQAYRDYIESQCVQYKKKMGLMVHRGDCDTSMCDSLAEGNRDNAYGEDEGDSASYFLPATDDLSSKFSHKKNKHLKQNSYTPRLYDASTNLSSEPRVESKAINPPFMINGKRPSLLSVGSIPTKRIRTASRQRIMTPFIPGVNTATQVTSKTDVSSGDTSSLQDDQSSLHGGSQPRKNLEIESTMDFERQLTYDTNETSTKVKKKKKPKHLGYKNSLNLTDTGLLAVPGKGPSFESRFQVDSMSLHDQKDYVKKRIESQHIDSHGTSVPYGQHAAKKPKLLKQLPNISPEAPIPAAGSMPSPAASQMSNMSNSNKLLKIISRDRGRKPKGLKLAAGQSGSGSPWSNYEDQALVVLVHDMGANWELVSDAINNILLFKHFFRSPKECKERHKTLLDKSAGDGADSAEDSGSSQPYPSSLPGIPKGSARQLLQRLQGPMEEDILKKHFDKIISLEQQLHSCWRQNTNQESKQIIPAHSSHVIAISQACPSHIKGGILTPLDLCDANTSSPDVFPFAYQGAHTGGLVMPSHQASIAPVLPATGVNTMLQGSPGFVLSSCSPSSSISLNPSPRDAQRYSVSRPTSLPVDDTQRMHQYSQMFSGRGVQQSSMPMNGPLQTGGNGVQVFPSSSGVNRSMPVQRSGLSSMPSNMLNMVSAGHVLSSGGQGMQNSVNIHPGVTSGPGNSMLRPRGSLHMLRPGENMEEHRQIMMQELQVQATQGNGQAITNFSGMNVPFPNLHVPSSVQTFTVHQHQQSPHMLGSPQHPHMQSATQSSSQQQAYAMRKQLQRRNQSQASFPGSNVVPTVQGNTQVQAPGPPSPVTPVASSPTQNKQQNMLRNLQPATQNPVVKQKQQQQVQQQQQRQQPHQHGKVMKSIGRPNMLVHQNVTVDTSQVPGFSTASRTQSSERQMAQQGQSSFPNNSGLSQNLPQSATQAKIYRQLSQSSKQMKSSFDSSYEGSSPSNMTSSQQPLLHTSMSLPSQHQQQHHHVNQSPQNVRLLQQSRQMNTDGKVKFSADQVQANQMITSTSTTHCTDSSTSAIASENQWKSDSPSNASSPTTNLTKSMPEDSLTSEILAAPSTQGSAAQQFSGSVPPKGKNVGGQWIQPQQQQKLHLSQHRPGAQGKLYVQSPNSGPG